MKTIVITGEIAGKRLDIALTEILQEIPRNVIKRKIESNEVYVNGEVEYRANYKVRADDEISIDLSTASLDTIIPTEIMLEVIYEDTDLIVIDKPSGMPVQPSTDHESDSVMNALAYYFKVNGQETQPKLIHRLDKNTSGVLLVAKTIKGQRHYSKQFEDRKAKKMYAGLMSGELLLEYKSKDSFEIKTYIIDTKDANKKMKVIDNFKHGAKEAKTSFKLLQKLNNKYLYELYPITGRTHQLRLHASYIGTPIIGDHMYGGEVFKRLMLHATSLSISNPDGGHLEFKSEVPKSFNLRYLN